VKGKRRVLRLAPVVAAAFVFGIPGAGAAVGTVTAFPLSSGTNGGVGITPGLDGNLWFTAAFPAFQLETSIGTISASGVQGATYDTGKHSDAPAITVGPDGNFWFTEQLSGSIARMTPSGTVTHFPLSDSGAQPLGITAGPDGNLWFTERLAQKIGRITPSGTITEFGPLTSKPQRIAAGADGNLWFTEFSPVAMVGRITPSGTITEYPLSHSSNEPYGIAPGPDGNVWVAERHANEIGRVTPAGTVTEFPMPRSGVGPYQLVTGADGNLWFTELDGGKLGRITTGGTVTEYSVPSTAQQGVITAGPDGNVWFPLDQAQSAVQDIARATVATGQHFNVLSFDAGFVPGSRSITLGAPVKWTFYGPRAHEVADSSGLGLFDSGPHSIVSFFSTTFTAAGVYSYRDPLHTALTGKISVPLAVSPTSGGTSTTFTVTWATAAPTGARVFDVQIKRPGTTAYVNWHTTTSTSATFTPDAGAGTYSFRARVRDTGSGAASGYSSAKPISVS
jgi:streptogramin lyase